MVPPGTVARRQQECIGVKPETSSAQRSGFSTWIGGIVRAVVTGGAGFIGSNIAEALLARDHEVLVVDDLSTGSVDNLSGLDVDFRHGSILDDSLLRSAFEGMDVVFHQAAVPSVPRSVRDPLTSHEANATGTLRVLVAAREAGVRRVVVASSSSVYGNTPTLPKVETMPTDPRSPYAVSKLASEHYCRAFWAVYGLETVALRYFNVFGPKQDPTSAYAAAIPAFITACLEQRRPTVYGDGLQTRDFTYVENVVTANLLAAAAPIEAAGQWFNIACGQRVSLVDLLDVIRQLTDAEDLEPLHTEPRPGDVRDSLADIAAAGDLLGYAPQVGLEEGLRRTVDWLRSTG